MWWGKHEEEPCFFLASCLPAADEEEETDQVEGASCGVVERYMLACRRDPGEPILIPLRSPHCCRQPACREGDRGAPERRSLQRARDALPANAANNAPPDECWLARHRGAFSLVAKQRSRRRLSRRGIHRIAGDAQSRCFGRESKARWSINQLLKTHHFATSRRKPNPVITIHPQP